MQVDPNSHQGSEQDTQANSEIEKLKQPRVNSKRFFGSHASRRSFLGRAGLFSAASLVAGVFGSPFSSKKGEDVVQAQDINRRYNRPFNYNSFVDEAYRVRVEAARVERSIPIPPHPTNGDEERYANKIGSDSRGLPHNGLGEVKLEAYNSLTKALTTQNPNDYENIILGGGRKLVNPQGPLAISLEGINAAQIAVPPPPALASAERAAEAVELYWQALLRDVPLSKLQNNTDNPKVLAAVEDLNNLSAFRGPKQNGRVTPQTLFRGSVNYVNLYTSGITTKYVIPPGVLDGPYISQFLLRTIPWGTQSVSPLIRTALPGNDFLLDFQEWLTIQNGGSSGKSINYDPKNRYIVTVRDLGEYAHIGGPTYLGASLILGSIGTPLNPGNPYVRSKTQVGSAATFAAGHLQALLNLGSSRVIRASYWQKFYVHRILRPEAFGGLVYNNIVNKTQYPINSEVFNSKALAQTFSTFGTYLLPQAYPEGAPIHSSYTGGAAANAGVNVTLLKAFFDENFVIPDPVVPDPNDPTKVIPYSGPPLTVGGELNKLATNYAIGRGHGGIHWRSDGSASLALGEEVAISLLRDERLGYNEIFNGFTFTKFDGSKVTV
ncbi:vanadium-dependent haloperoxidase [Nostoc sp. UCD121]|uniref:vanadium-dependent haloperoxidase n=1 Tax=unclassified Nostoc TaxID=2593658 RepID=UPI001627E26D|nr:MULTISPECIES: vanadium-dependent haloperoxidase [unclassified Nostoc]MBC1224500.1 vanadium-dependent haloperoxidase [Nostoc sp. UCD120]MBC1274835.1 vanadium-dependent haloperoxidase [Nostoc sp. UCD121]MBC1296497.1 vanadium-dependent haloperoxidase [Nostoc sp. UCD122]